MKVFEMIAKTWTAARKTFYRARGYYAGSLNGLPFRLDPYHSKFWRKASAGRWEPETFAVLDAYLNKEQDYLDIGAWIGPTTLYGAARARRVYCFEPDPVAFRYLAWNLELNGVQNVSAFSVALSRGVGIARMASFGGEAGDSMTSLLTDGDHGSDVITLGWKDFSDATDLSKVSLVKMDIEGAEFDVLPSLLPWLKAHRPALYLSTHAPFLDAATRQHRMQELADSLSFYDTCLEDNGRASGFDTLTQQRALTQFPTFLFKG
ncbi:FkbM family methyltransferase [Pseudophaeobacter profundi]|uniref:FkbM family methyltransferase n=1 Tax=Pseudophaeobacter profundi TaxID=3034152 RepID=UPI0024310FD6|nr:FkbM family methyltransferase [Pseudophaeobacter profundi]